MSEDQKHRQQAGRLRLALILTFLVCVILVIVIIVLVANKNDNPPCENTSRQQCQRSSQTGTIILQEPDNPSVFHDLTKNEIRGLLKFLHGTEWLNLTLPSLITQESSFKFLAEVNVPNKADVLQFLDNGGGQPPREARVTIFRGDKSPPFVVEYIVGPLPSPTYINPVPGRESIPFAYRPFSETEIFRMVKETTSAIDSSLGDFLLDIYDGTLRSDEKKCDKHCLQLSYYSQVSSAVTGEEKRMHWLWLSQSIEYLLLHSLDFGVLVNTNSKPVEIEAIWFNGTLYNDINDLKNDFLNKKYENRPYNIWPDDNDNEVLFSEAKRRGSPFTKTPLRGPDYVQPDGARFSVEHNLVTYLPWSFNFRMSSMYGPELYDIRYKGERIAYEISLQELCVFYSGFYIMQKYTDFFDSLELMGRLSTPLVPGVDCPSYATFIDSVHSTEETYFDTYKNTWCLFELNTGDPLRRHLTDWPYNEAFYEGLENVVLVLRTILTIMNYDYIIDFRFFITGGMQVKVISTGFITTSFYSPLENPYGYRLHDTVTGNIHQHLVNFKVDLDIKGTNNRFETLNLEQDVVDNPLNKDPDAKYYQAKFSRDLKQTEMDAAYRFNFSAPKYLTILNEAAKNKYGVPQAYRVKINGMSKVLLEEGQNNEPSASWARYQMAVTKRKETERHSSTVYGSFNSAAPKPVMNFQDFLEDNENIVDEDLVAWITLGMHHIPHTEDLPITPTPGMDVSFFLLPYNYFTEDPSIASQDSVRIEPNLKDGGLNIDRKHKKEINCYVSDHEFWEYITKHPGELFYDE